MIIAIRDILDWDIIEDTDARVSLRPSAAVTSKTIGYGFLAFLLSGVFYFFGVSGWWSLLLHAPLWLIGIIWPISMLYQRIAFSREGKEFIVEGVSALRPYRKVFPAGETGLQLSMTMAYTHGGRSRIHTGYHWKIFIHCANSFESLQVAYTVGTNPPGHIPPDARNLAKKLSIMIGTRIIDQSEGGTRVD